MSSNPPQATPPTRLINLNDTVRKAIKEFQESFWIDNNIYQKMEAVRNHAENYLHKNPTEDGNDLEFDASKHTKILTDELCLLLIAIKDEISHKAMASVNDGEPPHTDDQREGFSVKKQQSMDRVSSIIQELKDLSAGRS